MIYLRVAGDQSKTTDRNAKKILLQNAGEVYHSSRDELATNADLGLIQSRQRNEALLQGTGDLALTPPGRNLMTIRLLRAGQGAIAGLSAALLLVVPGPVSANGASNSAGADSAPDKITVEVVTVNGSGCPAGTANVSPFGDNTGFRVNYRRFVARTGADPVDFRKNCQLNVAIHIPQGFTYAIARADYRGVARLRRDASALLRGVYYFQGSSDTLYLDHTLEGPFNDRWQATDITDVAALVFAPCGRTVNLNINSDLRVHDDSGSSFIAMTSSTGDVDTLFHFHWKRC